MKKLSVSYPKSTINKLVDDLVPSDADDNSEVELTIKIKKNGIKSRELGSFLTFCDKIYGRTSELGIYHYAHNRSEQLEISKVKEGCIEVIVNINISDSSLRQLVLLYIVIKYLPSTLDQFIVLENEFEESRLSRINRRLLKEQMKYGKEFKGVSNERLNRFIMYLEFIILKDKANLPSIMRFIRNSETTVSLSVNSAQENNPTK